MHGHHAAGRDHGNHKSSDDIAPDRSQISLHYDSERRRVVAPTWNEKPQRTIPPDERGSGKSAFYRLRSERRQRRRYCMAHGIAAVGECMIELSSQGSSLWRMGYAGGTVKTLWAMRALMPGYHVDYVSAFGDDPFSNGQIEFFKSHDIGIANSPILPGARPGLYAITLTGAERSFTYWRNDAAARRLADDPAALAKSLENRELIYFSGITLAILPEPARRSFLDAVAKAREHGAHIAFDPNYRPKLWPDVTVARAAIGEALAVTDI